MASFSTATRELVLKLVYYGPGLGGKTTTLKSLHAGVRAEHRGKMISLTTPVDRTLYFDFLPVRLPSIGDLQLRLQLFTVPGQVYFNATRKLVLTGADGIVFVADSQRARLDANVESLDNLRDNLAELGREFETVPLVLAYNKRDLPDVLSVDEMDRELNPHGFPSLATAASAGLGVFETLDAVVRLALDDLRERRVIPADIAVPDDGIIAERLSDVRTSEEHDEPPRQIVAGVPPRALSGTMDAISIDGPGRPAPAAPPPATTAVTAASAPTRPPAPATSIATSMAGLVFGATMPPPPAEPAAIPLGTPKSGALVPGTHRAAATPVDGSPRVNHVAAPPVIAAPPLAATAGAAAVTAPPAVTTAQAAAPPAHRRAASFAPLFLPEDQDAVRTIEDALGEAILPRAILLLEALLTRVLERAARAIGRVDAPPEAIAWTLALPPERYARVRAAAQRARRGGEISRRDALEAYVVVAMAQLAADALVGR